MKHNAEKAVTTSLVYTQYNLVHSEKKLLAACV